MSIPVIDFTAQNADKQFADSLKNIGFAVIEKHPISPELIKSVYDAWYDFFHSATKSDFAFDPKTHAGFICQDMSENAKGNDLKDIKEFYHFYRNGPCPEALREITMPMYEQLLSVASTLLDWVENNTPQPVVDQFSMPLSSMIKDDVKSLFRPIHYPPFTGDETPGAIRAAAHTDINFLTLLVAASAPGLQVLDRDGQWLDVPCNKDWITINVGDMLQECSGGYYPSTQHRVVNPEGDWVKKSRLTMPFFLHPPDGVRLSNRHTAESYRAERYAEIGLDDE